MTNVMLRCFLFTLYTGVVVGLANGVGSTMCNASLALVPSGHVGLSSGYLGSGPECLILSDRRVSPNEVVSFRFYHSSAPRKITGFLLYVTDANTVRVGSFTSIEPNSMFSGTRGSTCTDSSTVSHASNTARSELVVKWRMPGTASTGKYTFQALVLTADADGSNPKFFQPQCPTMCVAKVTSCQTINKASMIAGHPYMEIYEGSARTLCTSADAQACPSGVCDVSGDVYRLNGVCEALYVPYAWLSGLPEKKCDYGGYTFTIPPHNGFEVLVSGGTCSEAAPLSVALTPNFMTINNLVLRALPPRSCVFLGCSLSSWKTAHQGNFEKLDGSSEVKFNLTSTPNENFFCAQRSSTATGTCFCDDSCTRLRDCCQDFAYTCRTNFN